jgi:hypothetical protein
MDIHSATITLGVQTSREDDRTEKPVLKMRKLLADNCRGPYSTEIREFALILRIGGEMQELRGLRTNTTKPKGGIYNG